MSKKFYLLLALTLALAASAFYLWCVNKKIAVPVVTEPIPIQTSENESIDTSSWKTYRNEEYGFEFKYPREWSEPEPFKEVGGNQRTFIYQGGYFEGCCQGVRVEIIEGSVKSVYERRINNLSAGDLLDEKTKFIGDVKIQEMVYDTHYGENERVSFIPWGSSTIELVRAYNDALAEVVVETFQFIK